MIKNSIIYFFILLICSISYKAISYSYSPPQAHTGAPGEWDCTHCHSGTLITSGTNWESISLSSNFTGNGYIPDSIYSIKISGKQSGISTWGFETTVLDIRDSMAGSFEASGRVQLISSSNFSRDYVLQTSGGTSSTGTNSTDWIFKWKAPSKNVGSVKFYVSFMAANGDFDNAGDSVYVKTFTINPSTLLPTASIASNDTLACAGSSIFLKGSGTNTPKGWRWKLYGATPDSSLIQNPIVKYDKPGIYWAFLSCKNSKGFSTPDSIEIKVSQMATPILSSSDKNNEFCKGSSVFLSSLPKGMKEYNFILNGVSKQKSSIADWIYTSPENKDSIWVVLSDGVCTKKSNTIILAIRPKPYSFFVYNHLKDTVIFVNPGAGKEIKKFLWDFGDGSKDSTGAKVQHIFSKGLKKAMVTLTVTDTFGCTASSSMEVDLPASIRNEIKYAFIKIYPQPAFNSFKIELPDELMSSQISIKDCTGRTLLKMEVNKAINEINSTSFPEGINLICIEKGEIKIFSKLIIKK